MSEELVAENERLVKENQALKEELDKYKELVREAVVIMRNMAIWAQEQLEKEAKYKRAIEELEQKYKAKIRYYKKELAESAKTLENLAVTKFLSESDSTVTTADVPVVASPAAFSKAQPETEDDHEEAFTSAHAEAHRIITSKNLEKADVKEEEEVQKEKTQEEKDKEEAKEQVKVERKVSESVEDSIIENIKGYLSKTGKPQKSAKKTILDLLFSSSED